MIKTRYILLGAGALATLYGVNYLMKLNRFSQELESVTKVSVYKVSLAGIELQIDVRLKNPSGGSLRVKQPFVKLVHENTTVASSQIENVNITVPKFSEVNMEPIRINIGFLTLAAKFPTLLKEYRDNGQIKLTVKTITTINDKLPYTKTDNVTLGGGKKA